MASYTDYPEVTPSHGKQTSYDTRNALHSTPPHEKQAPHITSNGPYLSLPPQPSPPPHESSESNERGRERGLTTGILITIVALVVLLVGAAIGGGVGGSLAVKKCNEKLSAALSTSPTSTIPSTSASSPSSLSASTAISTPIPQTGCQTGSDFSNTYTSIKGYTFNKICAHEIAGYDIVGVVVSSWELCMEACANYNSYKSTDSTQTCLAVTFVPSWIIQGWGTSNTSLWTNCGLKYYVPTLPTLNDTQTYEKVVSVLKS